MTHDQFIATYNGKPLEVLDSNNKYQCMDLAFGYARDVYGLNPYVLAHLYAHQVYTDFSAESKYFDRIPNTPEFIPQRGDFMVWGTSVGVAGHIGVVHTANINTFVSFDQNWNGHSYCELVTHNYNGVLGVLRYKGTTQQGGNMTIEQQDKLIKGMLGREPSEVELNDTTWRNNPGLAIDTLWENGGKQRYAEVNKPKGYEPVKEQLYRKV